MITRMPTRTTLRRIELSETAYLEMLRKPALSAGVSDLAGRLSGTAINSEKDESALDGLYFDEGLVWEGDYTISEQGHLLRLSGYVCVTGSLLIESKSIRSLNGLEHLTYVGEDLFIRNTATKDLDGLSGLITVGGTVRIEGNWALREMDSLTGFAQTVKEIIVGRNDWSVESEPLNYLGGLSSLAMIGGDLLIGDNCALKNLCGIENLASIDGNLCIWANDSLKNLRGLSSLVSVGGHVELWGNPALENCHGLGNVTSIGGDLTIGLTGYGNDALTSVDGVESLMSVAGNLTILDNPLLTNMNGLIGIANVGGDLCIVDNNALHGLDGLSNLSRLGGERVQIANNCILARRDAEDLGRHLTRHGFAGNLHIASNSDGIS